MLVYGVRCAPNDLMNLPADAEADYYLDYGLLVFPAYTRPTSLRSYGSRIQPAFWKRVARVLEQPLKPYEEDREQPYITSEEAAVVAALRESYPSLEANWYYVPRVVSGAAAAAAADDDDE
jgi:hypothetical protein